MGARWEPGRLRMCLALALVLAVTGAYGRYTVQKAMNQCAGYCKGTAKFNYDTETIYHYDYEVDVSSAIEGATGPGDRPSQMMIRAKADLAALDSPCDLTLTLKDVALLDPENLGTYGDTEEFAAALQKNPLRFSLQHGKVEELCSLPGEPTWVLNFKRGLLSSIQNSMDDLKVSQTVYETDIAGSCETRYTAFADMWWEEELWGGGGRGKRVKGAKPMTTIRRTKDLASCSERTSYFLSLQANPTGRSKARHMLRSTHECEQSVSEEPQKEQSRYYSSSEEEEDEEENEEHHQEFTSAKVGGVLLRSECRERHLFEPFSYHGSGATTNVTTRLILRSKEPSTPSKDKASQAKARGLSNKGAVVPYTYSTLLYDHSADNFVGTPPEDVGGEDAVQTAVQALAAVEAATVQGVSARAPTAFAALIAALRRLSQGDLMTLFKVAATGRSRKFILDAMPVVATAASMSAFRDLHRSGDVSDTEMDTWMGGVAFLKRPTLPMIDAVTPLLEGDPRPNSVLGVTALLHSYCRYGGGDSVAPPKASSSAPSINGSSSEESDSSSSEEDRSTFSESSASGPPSACRDKAQVERVMARLEGMLGQEGCRFQGGAVAKERRMAEAYLALKGLGNAGVAPSPEAIDSISRCYKNPEVPNDLRLAAVDVLRRVPCHSAASLRAQLVDTYANVSVGPKETEIRIAAYLASMKCATIDIMKIVKDTLEHEEANQVGSFVWTHLTNLRSNPASSSETYSITLSEIMASKKLRRKFRSDVRRFSRHYRVSTGDAVEPPGSGDWHSAFGGGGISALGAGADAEASVVLSPESYIPRSASLNLTVRLFGAEVDLLDVGARAEGLEPLVESIFGPSGGSNSPADDSVVSRRSHKPKKSEDSSEGTARRFNEAFLHRKPADHPVEPRGSGYVRVFGNELYYGRFRGLGEMLASFTSRVGTVDAATGRMRGMFRDPMAQLAVALAQQRELEFSRSLAFLDAALVMPTSAGLPLTLVANGTASVALSVRGRMDMTGRAEGNFDAEGVLAPSAALMVTGTMFVTASDVSRSGLRLDASLRTNTRAEGRLRYRRGKLAEASFTAPRDAGEEVFAVRSELFVLGRKPGEMRALEGRGEGREEAESCTPKAVSKAIGCEVCAKASYPNATGDDSSPRFPLTGPALVSVALRKTDSFARYEIKYEFKDEVVEEERGEGRGTMTDDEYLEEMRTGGKRYKRVRNLLLYFDTPGSKVNRKIRGALMVEGGVGGASMVHASVETPWTRPLEVVAGLENTASARGVGLTATLGGEEVVTAQAELRSVLRRPGTEAVGAPATPSGRYEPSVTVTVRGRTLIDLHGRVDYVHGSKYSGDLLLAGEWIREPVTISGDLTSDGGRYDLIGSVKSSLIEGTVQGNFKRTVGGPKRKGISDADRDAGKFVNAKATFKYSIRGGENQTFEVSARYLRNAKGALAKDSAYLTVLSTQFPQYEIDATWDSSISEGPYFEGRGRLTLGKDGPRWETRPLLVLRGMDHLAFRFFLACRAKKLHYDISLKHQFTDQALKQHAILRMGTNHEFAAALNFTRRDHPTARYNAEFEVRLPKNLHVGQKSHSPGQKVLAGRASIDGIRRRTYELGGGVEWWWGPITGAATATGIYEDRGNRSNSDRALNGTLWVVHGMEMVDKSEQQPYLDFSVRLTQGDRRASLYASTERPRKYKMEAHYARTGQSEHTLMGWAELSMGKKYDGKVVVSDTWPTKGLYLELGLGRRMSLDTKLHLGEGLNGFEVDLFWDKENHMRLSTGATVEFLGVTSRLKQRSHGTPDKAHHGSVGSIWLEYPGRSIRGQGRIMPEEITANLSWAPERAISIAQHTERNDGGAKFSLKVQTPFQGIESQSASAVYTWDGKRFNGKLDARWRREVSRLASELTMVLPADGASPWDSNADLELKVTSTMESVRDVLIVARHRASQSPLGTNTTGQIVWNGAEVFFTNVAWALEETDIDLSLTGEANLRSTGTVLRQFGAKFDFDRRGDREADMTASLSWRRPFDTKNGGLDMGFSLSGLKTGTGYFNLTADIGEYENCSAVFSFSSGDEGGKSVMSSELYLDGIRSAVASVSGVFMASGVANVDVNLEAPWFSAIEASLRHNFRDGEGLREQLEIKYGGDKVTEVDIEAALRSKNDFVVRITGGVGGTVGSSKLEHRLAPNNVHSLFEVTFNGETSSLLLEARDEEGEAPKGQTWRPRVLHGSVTATSPRLRSGRLRFVVDFARTGKGNFETAVAAPGISGKHSLVMKDLLNWESRLECYRGWEGYVQLPVVNVTLVNGFDGTSFSHFSHTYMRGLEQAITFDLKVAWGGENHPQDIAIIGNVDFSLPWTHPISINLEVPKSKTNEAGITVLQPKIFIIYGEEQKNLTIIARMERGGPLTSIISEVSMNSCQPMSFGISYNFAADKKTVHLFASMDNNERAETIFSFQFPNHLATNLYVKISPAGTTEFTVISLDFDLLSVEKYFKLLARTEKDSVIMHTRLDILAKMKIDGWKFNGGTVIEAPVRRSISLDIDLTSGATASVRMTKNSTDYFTLSGAAEKGKDNAKLSIDLTSQIEGMEKVSFIVAYDKIDDDHHLEAVFDRDHIKSILTGKLRMEESQTEIQAVMRLPIAGYEYMKAEAIFNTIPGPSLELEYQRMTYVYKISGNAEAGSGYFNASLNIKTPYEGYKNLDAKAQYSVDSRSRRTDVSLLLDFNGAQTSILGAVASPTPSAMQGNIVILTPLRGFEKVDASLYYNASRRGQLDARAHLITMGGTSSVIFSGKIEESANSYEGRLLTSSPYLPGSIGTFGLEAEYLVKRKGELRINIGNQIPAYTLSIAAIDGGTTAVITTPIQGYRKLSITMEKDLINKTAASVLVTKEDEKYKISGRIENWRNHSANASIKVETAIAGWEEISCQVYYDFPPGKEMRAGFEAQRNQLSTFISARVTGRLSRKAGRASAVTRWNFASPEPSEFSVDGIYDISVTEKSMEVNANTPFQGYEILQAKSRVEKEVGFAMLTMPSVSYLIKGKRDGDKSGSVILSKNKNTLLFASATLDRGREFKLQTEVNSSLPGYEGRLETSILWNRLMGRVYSLNASGIFSVEGFNMERKSSADVAVSLNRPDEGSMVKVDISTPLVSYLENFYLSADYNGKGSVEAKANTVFEGYEDVEGTATWDMSDLYSIAITARRGEEIYVSHNEMETISGLFRVTTNLTTPIEGFEELGSVTRFFWEEENENKWNVEVEIKTLLYDEVMLGVEGHLRTKEKALETEVILNTINPGYETINAKFEYDFAGYSPDGLFIKAHSEAEGRTFFTGSGVYKDNTLRLKLSVPPLTSQEIDGVAVLNDWRNSEIRLKVGEVAGNIFINIPTNFDGKIKFESNFKGYELIEAVWKKDYVENFASTTIASAHIGADKVIQFSLIHNPDLSNLESEFQVNIQEDRNYGIFVRWELLPESREFQGRVDATWADLGKVMEVKMKAEAPQGRFSGDVRANSSQWRGGKETSVSVVVEYAGLDATADSLLKWGDTGKEMVHLKGKLEVSSLKAVSNLEFTTPFTEPLFVSLDYNFLEESPKSVSANYRYGTTSYSVTGKVNKNEFDFELKTPITEYSKLKIRGSKLIDRYNKEVLLMYELGRETKGEMIASVRSELKKPYEVNFLAKVHGANKWSVEGKLNTTGPLNVAAGIDLKWGDGGNLKFEIEWKPPEKARLEVNLSEWVSPIIVSWELEGPEGTNKGVNLQLLLQSGITEEKTVTVMASLTPDDSGMTIFEVTLDTPGDGGAWTAKGNVAKKNGNSFEVEATLLRGGSSLANVKGTMVHEQGSHTKISLKGGSAVFEAGYDVSKDTKEAHLLAIYGESHKIHAKANAVLDPNAGVRGSLSVETNFASLKKIMVEAELGGKDNEREAALRAEWDGGRVEITANAAFVEETGAARGMFAIRTPWKVMKSVEMEATAKVKGPRYEVNANMTAENDFNAAFDATLDVERYEADFNAAFSGPQGKSPAKFHASAIIRPKDLLKIRLETPFMVTVDVSGRRVEDAYDVVSDAIWGEGQKMKLKGKLRSQPEDYGFNGELELNGKRVAIDAFTKGGSLPPENGRIEGGFSLVTPFNQFPHMNMYFSLLRKGSHLIDGHLNMTTPFEALPRLSATLSLKEHDRGLTGELRANADSKYICVGAEVQRDLLGKNAVNMEADLPLLGESSPLVAEFSLQNDRPDWRDVSVDAKASFGNATYGAGLAYAFVNYRVKGSFSLASPRIDYRGGISGSYENNSLTASASFKENALNLFYQLDKVARVITGNISMTMPDLKVPDASVTITAAFLEDIVFYSTYKFGNTSGLIDIGYNGRGLVANLLVPPMFDSKVAFKFLYTKEARKYNVDAEFSFGDSKHMSQMAIEMFEHVIVNGKLMSTSYGDRDIAVYLRKDKKVGNLSISEFLGGSWDASQQSTVAMSFMWKGTEHRGKFELKTVGRYSGSVELSSPWLPTGGVNASAFYSNEIDALKAEIKCETKRGSHSVYFESGENEGRKATKAKIIQYSRNLIDIEASILFGEGLADASAKVVFKESSHKAEIYLNANPITVRIDLDSDLLKKSNSNSLSINSTINIDEMKGHVCIQTPYSILESANFTGSSWFTKNGHLVFETTASVKAIYQGVQKHHIAIATLKIPYPYAEYNPVKQYIFELNITPGQNKFLIVFDYEVQQTHGHVNVQFQLRLDDENNVKPIHYDIKAYGKVNKEELSGEGSGLLVWAGRKYGELEIEFGKNKYEDGFVLSSQITVSEDEKYQGFVDIGQLLGKIELQWPQDKIATVIFEREIEGWEAFRVGLSMKTPFDMVKDVALKLKSVFIEDGYVAEFHARKENQGIDIKIDGTFSNDDSNIMTEGGVVVKVNGARLIEVSGHGRFLCDGISMGLDLKSIWKDFQDVHFLGGADWSLKGDGGPSLKLEVSYNGREFLAFAADCSYKTFSGGALLRTLWTLPASMRYELDFHSIKEMSGVARMCYNHCVGVNINLNGTKDISARLELPTRIIGADWAWKTSLNKLHCSTRLTWDRQHSLGFNLNLLTTDEMKMLLEIDLPVRSFKLEAINGIISENNASFSNVTFYWDAARNTSKSISVGMTILRDKENGNIESQITIAHPALRRDIVLRIYCSPLQLPFWGRLELEYSPNEADLFVSKARLEGLKAVGGHAKTISLLVAMKHQSSGLDVRIGAQGASGSDKAGGQLAAKYVDTRGRERTIVLSAKAHRIRRSLQLKADTNENSLSVRATLENIGLRLETKVNRKPPLMLRFLVDREMPAASFEADHGRRRYKVYFGSTEKAGSGPIKSVTARLTRRDVDDDAPPSTISVAPSVETVLSGTTVSLNTSRVLSTRFLWEQRGGLRTPDVPATLSAASVTMGGWIREAYSDVGHAWAAVAGEAAAGFLGEGTTHKLRFWYLSIEDEVEGFSTYSRYEVNALVEDFRSLEEMMSMMYSRNDFFIQDIDRFVVSALEKLNVATSCVSKFFKEAVMEAYVILRKATSAILASASRLVGDAIEATGSAVSSALPDPAEAARRLGAAAGRVATTARRVGAAVRGAARRLALWAEGVVEAARAWAAEKRARASQAVWDWAAAEAERMRPAILIFHSYVIRFKEIVDEVHQIADDISISIRENLVNVREIMELGEMVDYYTHKVRHLEWHEVTAMVKGYFNRTWETIKEDFRNGLGEYREVVMQKYAELIGRYDQFMQLPQVVEFTGTVKFLRRKAMWTWHYLELGDHLQRLITNFLMDEIVGRVVTDLASQMISEASRDPNAASDSYTDSNVETHIRGTDRSYALEAGYFEYNVKLPFDWDSFDSVPHFRQMWETPKDADKTQRSEEKSSGPSRPGSTAFTRLKTVVADALLDASSAKALMDATDGEINAAAALAALALPPFPSSALVAGDSHFVTFDGRDYRFSSTDSCSYLLAADLEGGTFSLLANYNDKGRRRSVSVVVPGDSAGWTRDMKIEERRIDVSADGRVSVDGRRVELPIEVGSATVGKEGERVVVEVGRPAQGSIPRGVAPALDALQSSSASMVLDCNPFHNVCTVRISGWFFSRTGGLLGTYNNEPSDDFETPDGSMVFSKGQENEFAESWKVGNCSGEGSGAAGGSPRKVSPTTVAPSALPAATGPCDAFFDRELDILSPLQPCFSRVDPAPYGRLCEMDVAAASNSPSGWETAACASAAAYVAQCRNAGMDIWVPQSCVKCHLSDGSVMSAGETKIYGGEGSERGSPAPHNGDVVFLVEQRPCLRGTNIANLAIKLDTAMRARGLRDNRFALVGFNGGYSSSGRNRGAGGKMASRVFGGPHTHTVDGKIWSNKRHFEKAFRNMQFDGREGSGPGGRTTPIEALWYAARLPFRDGVSKTVVLIMCGDCRDATDAAYADAAGMLVEEDITLHVLAPTILRTRRQPGTGPAVAIGFDSGGAFTTRNVRSLVPNRDLKRQLAIPKDLCSPLALETNGTRFDVGIVLGGTPLATTPQTPPAADAQPSEKEAHAEEMRRKRQRKFALDVFVRRVALTASPSSCQKCDCVANREGVGRVACQRCLFSSMELFFKNWESLVSEEDEDADEDGGSSRTVSHFG
ncbi:uncharacterized protein LOC124161022 [Ischnura elegans]|uniref:uncharacterized protein LOC124161022 n=1 Tax=Ischnura elegans TaxID=197161 RepID=UPI001ED8B9C5|nr:uncharacterized protein LOC124161022 [Ischnura elegans]